MGRIKSTLIKRTSEKLMDEQQFNDNFEDDKKLLNGIMPSKRMRNMIAGYIARKVKAHAKQKQEA